MAYNYEYPGVNMNDYNNDWILEEIDTLSHEVDDYTKKFESDIKEIYDNQSNIQQWISDFSTQYAEDIIKKYIATMIFVEISVSGYLIYNIPEHWSDITFNTTGLDIYVSIEPEYGHLVLSY